VDVIDIDAYNILRQEFMAIFEEEEKKLHVGRSGKRYSAIMKDGGEVGTFWYTPALRSPTGVNTLFYKHVQPHCSKTHADDGHFYIITCLYWARNVPVFIKGKIEDEKDYDEKLRGAFEEP
jgi:hypothetical protein